MGKPDIVVSPLLACNTPFIEMNDQTRLQMAHQQTRQAVHLLHNEIPLVQTTLENQTLQQNLFEPELIIAKRDGVVVYVGIELIIVQYENSAFDYWYIGTSHETLSEGDEFSKGDIIAQVCSYFIDTTIAQGRNLLAAVMNHPYAYEDALVLSENVKDKLESWQYETKEIIVEEDSILLSISKDEYRILPKVGEVIKRNEPFLVTKKVYPDYQFLSKPKFYKYNKDIEIRSVEVFPQKWNTTVREYSTIMRGIKYQMENRSNYIDNSKIPERLKKKVKLHEHLISEKKVYFKKKRFKGVYIRISYRYKEPVGLGDKFSNRYANKSTLSYLAPTGSLPKMDGREADIVISPMSIISRMNVGQLYETYASGCLHFLSKKLKDLNFDEGRELVMKFYSIIDNTNDKRITAQAKRWLNSLTHWDQLINHNYVFPAPPFESSSKEQLFKAAKLVGYPVFFDKQNIHMGYMYFYRLVHIARHKVVARSIGQLSKKTMQPSDGSGAQRLGEMEVWTLLAYDSENLLREMLALKSDDLQKKIDYILKTIYNHEPIFRDSKPESTRLLDAYFSIIDSRIKREE